MQQQENKETEHLYRCLARDLLTRPLQKRQSFLRTFEKKHGSEVVDMLKLYMTQEFEIRRARRQRMSDEAKKLREDLKR